MKTMDSYFGKAISKKVKHEEIALEKEEEINSEKEEENDKDTRSNNDEIGMSDYEKVRIENIRRNEEFLLNLGLDTHRQTILVSKQGIVVSFLLC
jgi:hypothetical protein